MIKEECHSLSNPGWVLGCFWEKNVLCGDIQLYVIKSEVINRLCKNLGILLIWIPVTTHCNTKLVWWAHPALNSTQESPGLDTSTRHRPKTLLIILCRHAKGWIQCSGTVIPVPRLEHHWKSVGWFQAGCPCWETIEPDWTSNAL